MPVHSEKHRHKQLAKCPEKQFSFIFFGQEHRNNITIFLFQRFFEFTSRILTLVLFAYAYKLLVLIPICTHWIFMIGWQIYLGANFHDTQSSCVEGTLAFLSTSSEDSGFFQMVMAFLQVFLFFHLCEGPSRENMCKVEHKTFGNFPEISFSTTFSFLSRMR